MSICDFLVVDWKTLSKSIKSQQRRDDKHNAADWKTLSKSIKSQPQFCDSCRILTERHYQRASNHNISWDSCIAMVLKDIIKEHQITTYHVWNCNGFELKDIIKEHQITTEITHLTIQSHWKTLSKSIKSQQWSASRCTRLNWKTLSKSIKSQLGVQVLRDEFYWKTLSKSIKSQQLIHPTWPPTHWKTLSKSIKSQLTEWWILSDCTERHYQRASNHNS